MIRLLIPLFVVSGLFWVVRYGLTSAPKPIQKGSRRAAHEVLISVVFGAVVLALVTLVFYMGGLVNGK